MSYSKRYSIINSIAENKSLGYAEAKKATLDNYGEDVFNAKAIREYLPKKSAEKLLNTINNRAELDPEIAADVAHGMKQWAIERGATHFTHWFQPLTGSTIQMVLHYVFLLLFAHTLVKLLIKKHHFYAQFNAFHHLHKGL